MKFAKTWRNNFYWVPFIYGAITGNIDKLVWHSKQEILSVSNNDFVRVAQ